jgi:hypothetical protein
MWSWYWHIWLSLRYWSFYPVMNPRTTRALVRVVIVAGVLVAHRRLGG